MSPQGRRSLNVFDLIDSICKEFRADWKAGSPPRIEDYLPRVPEGAREVLFRSLLPVDKCCGEGAGEVPTPTEYLGRLE